MIRLVNTLFSASDKDLWDSTLPCHRFLRSGLSFVREGYKPMERMSEVDEVFMVAHVALEDAHADPDDDLRMLSRQYLRALEKIETLENQLKNLMR